MTTTDPTSSDFAEAAYAWIDSAKAPKFAEGLLNGKRVKVPEKEILADVRSRIWERVQHPHDELDSAQAAAYCRAVARNLVSDLLRGFRDEDLDERLYYRKGATPVALNDLQPVAAESAGARAGEGIDDLRTWFEASGHEPWVVSGALTYVTVGSDPDCDYSAAPKPRAGPWDFVLYNAGMDPFNSGVSSAVLRTREQMVAEWTANAGVPTVVTIAGGYTWGDVTMEQLVGLHRSTFEEFAAAA